MSRGHFSIGIYNPRFKENIGTLWRSAYLLGASWIFTIGDQCNYQPTDTLKTWKQIPLLHFKKFEDMNVKDISIVAVETEDSEFETQSLITYSHPKICAYLLGNESYGIPKEIIRECDQNIYIPYDREPGSFNVSSAGTIVMYDRLRKEAKDES